MAFSEYLENFDGPLARLVRACFPKPLPDPWPKEVDDEVRSLDAVPVCIDCLYPQVDHRWFCPHCGRPNGEYVTVMPFLQLFAVGEFFRKGVIGPPEKRKGVVFFLVLYSLCEYNIFAPLYWFWLIRRGIGKPICQERRIDLVFAADAPAPARQAPGRAL
jgi:hypothetical protein